MKRQEPPNIRRSEDRLHLRARGRAWLPASRLGVGHPRRLVDLGERMEALHRMSFEEEASVLAAMTPEEEAAALRAMSGEERAAALHAMTPDQEVLDRL